MSTVTILFVLFVLFGLRKFSDESVKVCINCTKCAIGAQPVPLQVFSAPVGGPLASILPEAASLLQVLRGIAANYDSQTPLLILVDCLVLLDILLKWGRNDFHPNPKDVVHFDIISPLLMELRQWPGQITLVKIKSHTGCLSLPDE